MKNLFFLSFVLMLTSCGGEISRLEKINKDVSIKFGIHTSFEWKKENRIQSLNIHLHNSIDPFKMGAVLLEYEKKVSNEKIPIKEYKIYFDSKNFVQLHQSDFSVVESKLKQFDIFLQLAKAQNETAIVKMLDQKLADEIKVQGSLFKILPVAEIAVNSTELKLDGFVITSYNNNDVLFIKKSFNSHYLQLVFPFSKQNNQILGVECK